MSLEIRTATVLDAKMVCAAVRRSTTERCQADHRADTKIIATYQVQMTEAAEPGPGGFRDVLGGALPLRSEVG